MSEIVITQGDMAVVAGLSWALLENARPGRSTSGQVRRAMADVDASHFVLRETHTGADRVRQIGLYAGWDTDLLPSRVVALVDVLARKYAQFEDLAIAWVVKDRVAVAALAAGAVLVDTVLAYADAIRLLGKIEAGEFGDGEFMVLTNDPSTIGGALITTDDLIDPPPASDLKTTPPNWGKWLVWLSIPLLVGIAGVVWWQQRALEAEKMRAIQKAANDPNRVYQRLLADGLKRIGLDRAGMVKWLEDLGPLRDMEAGWRLHTFTCGERSCSIGYERVGGQTSKLTVRHPEGHWVANGLDGGQVMLPALIRMSGVSTPLLLPPTASATAIDFDRYQTWRDAGVVVQGVFDVAQFELWPTLPHGADLRKKGWVMRGRIEVDTPLALAKTVLESTPGNVFWDNVTLKQGLRVVMKGYAYATVP